MNAELEVFKREFSHMVAPDYLAHCETLTTAVRAIDNPAIRDEALNALLKVIRWFHERDLSENEVVALLETIDQAVAKQAD